jgi:type I restriction enzyme R subunit
VIDFTVEYAQTLIDNFSHPDRAPHIAISVDMLDTGIDVPELVNLVFFKLVRSKTKFWQMLGRGTRLRPDLFGPARHKEFFYVFDYCQNLEYFSQNPETTDGAASESLGARLFGARLELIDQLDRKLPVASGGASINRELPIAYTALFDETQLRRDVAALLHEQVAAMNLNNFVVRPQRRLVEKYAKPESWTTLKDDERGELAQKVAGLPSEIADEDEDAKRFDLLMLRLQLTLLRSEPGFERLREQMKAIAGVLEEKSAIPMVRDQMALIQEIQTDEYWQDITAPILEVARKRLRALLKLIEKSARKFVYTDFGDEMGGEVPVALPGFGTGADFERFRIKARVFLREHESHVTIHKLRWNKALTGSDLAELERMLVGAGIGTSADIVRAKQEASGLGLFIRSLVGMDREAAKQAFGMFLTGRTPSANQIEFVNVIVDHLTEHGVMDPARLYESPFTDINPRGPEGVFTEPQVDELVSVLSEIRRTAAA